MDSSRKRLRPPKGNIAPVVVLVVLAVAKKPLLVLLKKSPVSTTTTTSEGGFPRAYLYPELSTTDHSADDMTNY